MFRTSAARPSRNVVLLAVVALSCGLFLLHGYAQNQVWGTFAGRETCRKQSIGWTSPFPFEQEFLSSGRNPYFKLEPGFVTILEGKEKKKTLH